MAYFQDLTDYSYGGTRTPESPTPDLNVGWLEAGHEFQRAIPDAGLVDALVRCCLWPVRLYRGFHECDLCPDAVTEMPSIVHRGRRVHLGNGEVRVEGPDQRWYAAPTLVAHYVTTHEYAPPAQFVAGVLQAASGIGWLDESQYQHLRACTAVERFDLCLELFETSNAGLKSLWLETRLQALRSARSIFASTDAGELSSKMALVYDALVDPPDASVAVEPWVQELVRKVGQILLWARSPDLLEERSLELSALVIERLVASGHAQSPL